MTVENPDMVLATAVFEYFPSQIAAVRVGFAGFDCHQATEIRQKRQYHQRLMPILLSVQENHVLERQYEKNLLFCVLSFSVVLAVESIIIKL